MSVGTVRFQDRFNATRRHLLQNHMFKTVHDCVWAFDAEWVPDPKTGRAVYGLPPTMADDSVQEEMWRRGGGDEENPRPYLKTAFCRLVSIAAVIRSVETEPPLQLYSLPSRGAAGGELEEGDLIGRFLEGVGRHHPQLIGFNSRNADFPILLQRGLVHGVSAPEFSRRPDRPWEGVDYFSHGEWHIDLAEILGARSRDSRPSLHEIATACHIPGKFSTGGGDVADLWRAGQIDEIVRYNEFDALTTYLVWLRLAHFGGFFTSEQYAREQELVEEFLRREGAAGSRKEHLSAYLEEWLRLKHSYQ